MTGERKRERTRDLLIGGVLGAFAAVARCVSAGRGRRPGLAAFEDALLSQAIRQWGETPTRPPRV
jgi:hypothetical protein